MRILQLLFRLKQEVNSASEHYCALDLAPYLESILRRKVVIWAKYFKQAVPLKLALQLYRAFVFVDIRVAACLVNCDRLRVLRIYPFPEGQDFLKGAWAVWKHFSLLIDESDSLLMPLSALQVKALGDLLFRVVVHARNRDYSLEPLKFSKGKALSCQASERIAKGTSFQCHSHQGLWKVRSQLLWLDGYPVGVVQGKLNDQ